MNTTTQDTSQPASATRPDCAPPTGSLSSLVAEWESLVPTKWSELRAAKGHFIAIFTPQVGHQEDLRRRRLTTQEVMRWTVEWFGAHGHAVECVLADDGESFGIREANLGDTP